MEGNLSLKSSVFSPVYRTFPGQQYNQNQLRAHYTRLASVQSVVDCKLPTTYNKSILRVEQKNRSAYQSTKSSRAGSQNTSRTSSAQSSTISQFKSGVNSRHRTPSPAISQSTCSVADKISCYLKALEHHKGFHQFPKLNETYTILKQPLQKKCLATSRLKKMSDCYTPAVIHLPKNKNHRLSINYSLDEFEEPQTITGYQQWLEEQSQDPETGKPKILLENNPASKTYMPKKQASDEKLDFIHKITEDILKCGLFSDRAIRETVNFHFQNCNGNLKTVLNEEELLDNLLFQLRVNETAT